MTGRRLTAVIPLLPAAAAAGLGSWGIGFGLPFDFRPDEDIFVGRAVEMAVRHNLDPLFYAYPPLGLYAFAAAEWVLGVLAPGHLGPATQGDPGWEYLAARLVSVAAFAAAAWLVGVAARAAYGTIAGLVAGTALAVAPLAVQNAHFARVDMLATALVALALWLGGRAASRAGWALAGLAAGLAAGTKYTAGMVAVYLVLLVILRGPDRLPRLLLAGAAALATFLVALAAVGDPAQLLEGLRFLGGRALGDYGLPIGFVYHPTVSLPVSLGPGGLLLAVAGLGLGLWRRRPIDLALVGFLAAYYLVVGFSHEVFIRYALPMLPPLTILAGGLIRDAGPARSWSTAVAAAAALLLVPSALSSVESDHLLSQTDTRILAARWLEANAPPGSELILASYWSEPFYDAAAVRSQPLHPLYLTGHPIADSFQLGLYDDRYRVNAPGAACYRLSASGPPWQGPVPAPTGDALATFKPYAGDRPPAAAYDPLDSFYLPLAGFGELERPGPSIVISGC